jgi:hypothetical protein
MRSSRCLGDDVPNYTVGLDLGQAADYTALAVVERLIRKTGETQWTYRRDDFGPPTPSHRIPVYEDLLSSDLPRAL